MKIVKVNTNFEREPLAAPFGFKGGYVNEEWQSVIRMESENQNIGIGVGNQGVLWSDAKVFSANSEAGGNSMMFLITSYAANAAMDFEWETPIQLLDQLLPVTYDYAKKVTDTPELRLTFALNALVAVDNAAWQLYCMENGIKSFDDMVPVNLRPALSYRQEAVAQIPLISYGVSRDDIVKTVEDGFFFLKIKIGSDPDKDGDQEKMLDWDKQRISEIHELAKDRETPYTDSGRIPYYLDANGRYADKDRLLRLLDHADKIGALERIMIIEEPFPEEYKVDVSDVPARLAADESAHSDRDALERIELGYGAIALKAIAKTMSMTLKIANIAHDRNVPCFCADLTVCPILVDWNKCVAARLQKLPGMKIGVLESNGHQNYSNWTAMQSYHPCNDASWSHAQDGLYPINDDFYQRSGGILEISNHYQGLVE